MRSFLVIFLLLFSLGCFGQLKSDLDSYFDKLEAGDQAMGSLAITKNGETVYQRSFGWSSLNSNVKADRNSAYWIGSISKTFTAVIILQMVGEGKLALQDKLSQFFPEWPDADKITIEQLLLHQSGLHNFGNDQSRKHAFIDPSDRKEIQKVYRQTELDFEPGSTAEYNNANYLILSLLAEEVDSTTFSAVLEKRVIDPLHLYATYLKTSPRSDGDEVSSYYWNRGWQLVPSSGLAHLKGFGGIVSTPDDLNTFFYALFHQHVLSDTLLEKMTTIEQGFGMGLFAYPFGDRVCFGHAGNIAGFEAMAAYFPTEHVGFALCLNGSRNAMNGILVELLKRYFGV